MSRDEVFKKLKAIKPELISRYGVKSLAIFGSYARGDYREDSDIDILVDVDPSIGLKFVDLSDFLEASLNLKADVVSKRAIKPYAWEFIKKELIDV